MDRARVIILEEDCLSLRLWLDGWCFSGYGDWVGEGCGGRNEGQIVCGVEYMDREREETDGLFSFRLSCNEEVAGRCDGLMLD